MHKSESSSRGKYYEVLLELTRQQLLTVEQSDQWNEEAFQQYVYQWSCIESVIGKLDDTGDQPNQQDVECLQELMSMHRRLMDVVDSKQTTTSKEVVGVRQSQAVMNAYYGMGRSDQVAYYFDEKK
ncbi:hypothetical protein [Paenibacillus sp. 1001270B_150601_E10]|uniref:hypothetical protein n=1 Tax=Paenibacillus sp. 1001270B_150601_E10 TaxID=2787079 RepID=UPI00189FB90E|nr:hypothetical protein [Paenibacillus sp. 1001270B_150601_E10]